MHSSEGVRKNKKQKNKKKTKKQTKQMVFCLIYRNPEPTQWISFVLNKLLLSYCAFQWLYSTTHVLMAFYVSEITWCLIGHGKSSVWCWQFLIHRLSKISLMFRMMIASWSSMCACKSHWLLVILKARAEWESWSFYPVLLTFWSKGNGWCKVGNTRIVH